MLKRIYIIEAKLSSDKIQQLNKLLESKQDYEKIDSCAHADYIVTELKSPYRIMRNVRKSTCPVVHITWLLESIRLEKQLDPQDYLIDISEARKQAIIDLSTRVAARALPRQLTWDQVALRRQNRSSFEKDSYLARNAGLQECSRFSKSYSSRHRSSNRHLTGVSNRGSSPRASPINLKKGIQLASILPISADSSASSANNRSYTTPIDNLEKDARLATHTLTHVQNNTPPVLLNGDPYKNQAYSADVCNDSESKVSFNTRLAAPSRRNKNSPSYDNAAVVNEADKPTIPNDTIVIKDDSYNEAYKSTIHNDIIVIEDDNDNEAGKESTYKYTSKDLNSDNNQGFSIISNRESSLYPITSQSIIINDSLSCTNDENISCSIEKISHSFTASSFGDAANGSLGFNCSSISSMEFDTSQYSLSEILSL